MCGRFMTPEVAALERQFNIVGPQGAERLRTLFNATPSMTLPVIRTAEGRREVIGMRWGLVPFFAKGDPGPYSTINARRNLPHLAGIPHRMEARSALPGARLRVLRVAGAGHGKQPWYIGCADQDIFAFAGRGTARRRMGPDP